MRRFVLIFCVLLALFSSLGCTLDAHVESLDKPSSVINKTIEPGYEPVFVLSSQSAVESVGTVVVPISIPSEALRDIKIDYTVSGSTITGTDHDLINGSAYINVGQTGTQLVFSVLSDTLNEPEETIIISLSHNSSVHTITIQDDDVAPSVAISSGTGFEGSDIQFPFSLSAASGQDITFNYSISHGTTSGSDFSGSISGVLTIPAGQITGSFSIPTLQDSTLDGSETFTVNFSNPIHAAGITASVAGTLHELLVEDIYPNNGHNWGAYLQRGQDLPCYLPNSLQIQWACVESGMQKKVKIPAFNSCSGLSLTDSQNAFVWVCSVVNSKVEFNILDFNIGKGLKHLVTEAGFNPIKVRLTQNAGPVIMESAQVNGWWSNPIIALPNNAGGAMTSLTASGSIYVEDTSKNVRGYSIDADNITVVAGPGVTLTLENATPNNCNNFDGETASPNMVVLFCMGSQSYTWLEANIQLSAGTQYAIFTSDSQVARIHGGTIKGDANDWAMYLYNSASNFHISQMKISDTYVGIMAGGSRGFIIEDTVIENLKNTFYPAIDLWIHMYFRLSRIRILNAGHMGIDLDSAKEGSITDIVIANTAESGIFYEGNNVSITNALLVNTSEDGIYGDGISILQNYLVNITAVNNSRTGIEPGNDNVASLTQPAYVINSTAANNLTGLKIAEGGALTVEMTFDNLFLGNNGTGISLDNIATVLFQGLFRLGGNTSNCSVTNPGVDVGITHSTCALTTPSTGTLSTSLNMSASFVGKAGTDSVNGTVGANTNTAIAYGSITDHSNFQNWFRVWGKNGSAYPNADNRGRCSSGTCNIWDYRLAPADTALRNINGTFVNGATCPASVHGDNFVQRFSYSSFLKYATEVGRDGIGNENGLCESNEACIFSPHVGAYQGDRTGNYLAQTCVFQDGSTVGSIKGVKMYALPE